MNVTGFYKDIRNLLGTEVLLNYEETKYARYVNRDYGNVRGITIAFDKRMSEGFGMNIDYTFQIAEGNSSDPDDVFNDNRADPPREPEKLLRPLDWDQTHTLNGTLMFGAPQDWNIGLIGRIGSGLPYTSNPFYAPEGKENDSRRPIKYNLDLKASKTFEFMGMDAIFTLWVYNLFDIRNENDVYVDTGTADYTIQEQQPTFVKGFNSVSDFYNRPEWYDAPRQVKIGLSFSF